jgi:hypothetical protein
MLLVVTGKSDPVHQNVKYSVTKEEAAHTRYSSAAMTASE